MTHWSGVRSGWNTRGGTAREHLELEERLGISHPDSSYWQHKAEEECEEVAENLGEDYEVWAEMTWPFDSIRLYTYRQIYETAHYSLDHLEEQMTCTCNPIDMCKVCQAQARVSSRIDDSTEAGEGTDGE